LSWTRRKMYCGHARLSVCLSVAVRPHYCTNASKLHPGPCSSVGVRPQTDRQTDRQTCVPTIHFAPCSTHAKCNKCVSTTVLPKPRETSAYKTYSKCLGHCMHPAKEFTIVKSVPICMWLQFYVWCVQRGLAAPVRTHWIGWDWIATLNASMPYSCLCCSGNEHNFACLSS